MTGGDRRVIDKVTWVRVESGRVLAARSHGKTVWYLPGGKREPGESDLAALTREVAEELSVSIDPATVHHFGTVEAPAHGQAGVVRMACYTAEYRGTLVASAEVAELAWLGPGDRDRLSAAGALVFDELHRRGELTG
ncbi:NUDIX hydrolase [Amycolatopsis viridis]|uniref:8-oxo-dGTP diphosphatase n=1 Tax=Amycolatopsis viridis TaxID=185678 RepID=A0ABX0SQ15_9PSEU|nr:NUDIX domain-containing protein [Amycolatopsis viridis]NIH79052.1 8-oxo-dGTP pyrophosphatase MutT (NUDIX family) [Amycolatopsis viridis]